MGGLRPHAESGKGSMRPLPNYFGQILVYVPVLFMSENSEKHALPPMYHLYIQIADN